MLFLIPQMSAIVEENLTIWGVDSPPEGFMFGYSLSRDPVPLFFLTRENNISPTVKVSPYSFVYKNFMPQYKILLPVENEEIITWFELKTEEDFTLNGSAICVLAYIIDPNGRMMWNDLAQPIVFRERTFLNQEQYVGNTGLSIDSAIPGTYTIKYMATLESEISKFKNLTDTERKDYSGFQTYTIHVISTYEKMNIYLIIFSIIFGIVGAILSAGVGFILSEKAAKRREKHERKSAIKSLINEIKHNEEFAKYILNSKKKYLEMDVTPFNDFCILNLELNLSKEYIKEDKLRNKLLDFYSFLKSMNEFLKRLRMPNISKNKDMEKNILPGAKRINKNSGEIIKSLEKELSLT